MRDRPPQAPVIPYSIAFTTTGSAPVAVFNGSGSTTIVMATLGATAGVLFGDSSSMSVAAANDAFPITTNVWVRVPISRATRFISVVALTGTTGTLYYYFPGQTDA